MIRQFYFIIGFLAYCSVSYSQFNYEIAPSSESYFEEELYFHCITEGLSEENNLFYEETASSEIELAQELTEYPYTPTHKTLLKTDDKSVVLQLVKKDIKNRKYREAMDRLNTISASDLADDLTDDYQFFRAYVLFVHKDFDQASRIFENVRSLKSNYEDEALYYSAFCDLFNSKYISSSEKFEKLAGHHRFRISIPYYLSILYYKQERYDEVIAFANSALRQISIRNESEIRELLRLAHYQKGNWDELSDLILADENCCSSPEEHYLAGITLYKQGNHTKAVQHLEPATKLASKEGQNALLALSLITHDHASKVTLLQKAAMMTYDMNIRDQAILQLARLYVQQGNSTEALSYTRRITEHSPYFDHALKEEISILYSNKEYDKALKVLLRLKSQEDVYKALYQELILLDGLAKLESGSHDQAIALLTEAAQLEYRNIINKQAHYWLAFNSFGEKRYAEALTHLNKYEQINNLEELPKECSILQAEYLKAHSYLHLNQYKNAQRAFANAEQMLRASYTPNEQQYAIQFEDILLRSADCFFAMGMKSNAETYYAKAYNNQVVHGDYALYQKGKIEDLTGEPFLQIGTFELLEREFPKSKFVPDSQMKRGDALLKMGRSKDAYDVFAKVYQSPMSREQDRFKSLMNMGLIHYNQGDIESALAYYKKIFKEGNLHQDQSNEALKVIEEIYLVNLKDSESYYDFLNGIGSSSLTHSDKDSIDYHLAISASNDDVSKGIELINHYLRKYPKAEYKTDALKTLAKLYEQNEQYDNAIAAYNNLSGSNNEQQELALLQIVRLYHKSSNLGPDYLKTNKRIIAQNFSESTTQDAYIRLSKTAIVNKKILEYEKEILKALELGKLSEEESEKIKLALVEEYVVERNYTKANPLLKELSQSKNEEISSQSLFLVANRLYDLNKLDHSATVLENILKKKEINKEIVARSLILRSSIFLTQKEYELAEAALLPVLQQSDLNSNILLEGELLLKNIAKEKKDRQLNESPTLELQYQEDEE